ncbi:MAG: hypothetical protein P8106_03670 [Gammaproteobacteria bacterium]
MGLNRSFSHRLAIGAQPPGPTGTYRGSCGASRCYGPKSPRLLALLLLAWALLRVRVADEQQINPFGAVRF